jgi:signal transduction histidine kinase
VSAGPSFSAGTAGARRSGRRLVVLQRAAIVAVVPLVVSAVWFAATSRHLRWPAATALYKSYLVAAPMIVGVVWCRRRPGSRFGPLLIAFGLTSWLLSWQSANTPLVYDVGVLGDGTFIVLNFYICLAFPTGRLETRVDRVLIGAFAVAILGFFWALVPFSAVISGAGPLSRCVQACPANEMLIASEAGLAAALGDAEITLGLAATAGMIVWSVLRLRRASRPRRRVLSAVAGSSLLLLSVFFAFHLLAGYDLVAGRTADTVAWALVAARVVFPLGFLLALWQAAAFAADAQRRLLLALAEHPTRERWRNLVAGALDDPSLEVLGGDAASERPAPGRLRVPVVRDGRALGAIDADSALADDPELLSAAVAATGTALETGRLTDELRESKVRIIHAGETERRRLERDLHDGAQQRLIALRIQLSLAEEAMNGRAGEERTALLRLGEGLDVALDELRSLAQGLYPPTLVRLGVAGALRGIAMQPGARVSIEDHGLGRYAETVESAVYFCCLEGLQNVAKHAGPEATASVSLRENAGRVEFVIDDDGRGFDLATTPRGAGLRNIEDRVAALGGGMEIDSAAGSGTHITGWVPRT